MTQCISCASWQLREAKTHDLEEGRAPCLHRWPFIVFRGKEDRECNKFKQAEQAVIDRRNSELARWRI